MGAKKKISARLTREEWLERALDVLAAEGPGKVTIESLARALGVSRGSFYWHFADRADFIAALLDYWHEICSAGVPERIESRGGTSEQKFVNFVQEVHNEDLTRFDMSIRAWAIKEPHVAKRVERTDHFRMDYIRSLFADMGFTGQELEVRSRCCLAYLTMDRSMLDDTGALGDEENIEELCRFLMNKR